MKLAVYCLGFKALKSLLDLKDDLIKTIDLLIIAEDKNIENDYALEIIDFAKKNNINYISREKSNKIHALYHIAIGWRWLIKVDKGEQLIVLHDSLLPKYRGFNPLVTALINGDLKIGVTALFAAESYDKGDIILQSKKEVQYPIKIKDAINLISELYSELFNKLLSRIYTSSTINSYKQNESYATYSLWRDEEDYFINWNKDAEYISRFVDAVGFPYKGACSYYDDKLIRIKEVSVLPDLNISNRVPGKLIMKENNKPIIVCNTGLIKIEKAIYENGETVIFKNFRIRLKNDTI